MAQKMLLCFTNIYAIILLFILGHGYCDERHILAHFFQTLLPLKASEIIFTKAALLWYQKCL
jgi:hypothetical protein